MKIISTCEKEFIVKCIAKNKRFDGRALSEGRTLEIIFGEEWGCCLVRMGNTHVLAQVSAEVGEPRSVSPTEGALHINLEVSSMSAPDVQYQSRTSDEFVGSQRILERCVRDSKCIDMESLCIVAGSKVWTIRVDIHALNDDGNLVECASVAAISALAHFKRPDVTVVGTEVTIHSLDDREPVPLNLHHMPISINLALFEQGEHILVDPIDIEEKSADGCYVIGMNAHQEICLVHRIGVLLLSSNVIQKCEDVAIRRSQSVTQVIRKSIDDDAYKRATKAPIGFVNMIQTGTILGIKRPIKEVDIHAIARQDTKEPNIIIMDITENEIPSPQIQPSKLKMPMVSNAAVQAMKILKGAESSIFEGGASKWKNLDDDEEEDESSDEDKQLGTTQTPSVAMKKETDSSDEDEIVNVFADQVDVKLSSRGWYSKDPFV